MPFAARASSHWLPALLVLGVFLSCGRPDAARRAPPAPDSSTRAAASAAVTPPPDSAAASHRGNAIILVRVIDSVRAPESVAIGPDGRYYVSSFGETSENRDGAVYAIDANSGAKTVYAGGLLDPCGIAFQGDTLWVADRNGVLRVTPNGRVKMIVPVKRFPHRIYFLNDIAIDRDGSVLVTDTGDDKTKTGGGVYRIHSDGRVSLVHGSLAAIGDANGILLGQDGALYAVGYRTGRLMRRDTTGSWHRVATGLGGPDRLAFDANGRLFVTDNVGGVLYMLTGLDSGTVAKPVAEGLRAPADLIVDQARSLLVVPENDGNRISFYKLPR